MEEETMEPDTTMEEPTEPMEGEASGDEPTTEPESTEPMEDAASGDTPTE
jgi:hypothetical protein